MLCIIHECSAVQDIYECVLCKIYTRACCAFRTTVACCSGYCFADGHEQRVKLAGSSSQPLRPADARMAIAASQEQMRLQLQILADSELAATIRAGDDD